MVLETIRLSQREKEHLVQLKRRTRIQNWNVLCRWAIATSLAEPSVPPDARVPSDSAVEMSWRVFGGDYCELYAALIRQRCEQDGLGTSPETLVKYFRLHLHRGIGYLFADRSLQSIKQLILQALAQDGPRPDEHEADPPRQDGDPTD